MGQTYIPSSVPATFAPSPTPAVVSSGLNDLFELSSGIGMAPGGYVAPKSVRKEKQSSPVYCLPLGYNKSDIAHLSHLLWVSGVKTSNSILLGVPWAFQLCVGDHVSY